MFAKIVLPSGVAQVPVISQSFEPADDVTVAIHGAWIGIVGRVGHAPIRIVRQREVRTAGCLPYAGCAGALPASALS